MPSTMAGPTLVLGPLPTAHFGAGAVAALPGIARATGGDSAVIVTDAALAGSPVVARVTDVLAAANIPATVFGGVHPNPTTDDVAAGAAHIRARPAGCRVVVVAVGGGSAIDAAKGIALAAVNPHRGRALDYRGDFPVAALPAVAVPTTAGTGAETNAFGVVTDPATRRKFYIGHATTLPAAAILDPELTAGLPPPVTAATGMDALTHALESYLSVRANPWADALARQVITMVATHLPRAVADGTDAGARSQMLLAAHMAGVGMATTGLGICHAIGHALGARFGIAHGVALAAVLPQVLRFNAAVCEERLAGVAAAIGTGDTGRSAAWNAGAAIDTIAALRDRVQMTHHLAALGVTAGDFGQIAADTLADEVLANTPRRPTAADIEAILAGASP